MADDRGRGDDNRSDDRDDVSGEVPRDLPGDVPGEEQDGPDQQGAPDDHPGAGDEGRARGESPFGCP